MKVISISTDRNIFRTDSAVYSRMKDYGLVFDELHIVVFSLGGLNNEKIRIARNVWAYPTDSFYKIFYIFDAFRIARRIWKRLGKSAVVTTQDPFETGVVGWLFKKAYGVRLSVQIHTDLYSPDFRSQSLLNRLRVFVAPMVLNSADSVRVVSQRIKNILSRGGIKETVINVLPVFVDKNKYDVFQDVARKENSIIAVSRLSKEKNLFFMVDVIKKVVNKKPEVTLTLIGDGPVREALGFYIKENDLDNNIFLVGWKEDVSKWYREAGVFLHTSLYEGYGMVFIEAALQHVPIISSRVGIMEEVFEDERSAYICPAGDVDCFANRILRILNNSKERQRISDSAYREAVKHLPESKESYLNEYKKTS